jgi:hypothetical protein
MPFLMAMAPVRKGRTCSLRSKAAVCEAPRTGREGEALKRLGLGIGLRIERIERVCVVGRDGQRKRGGRAKSRGVGWRGGIVVLLYVLGFVERATCVPSIDEVAVSVRLQGACLRWTGGGQKTWPG